MKKSQIKKGKRLTDTQVLSLRAENKEYSVSDTNGLYLFIKPTGAKNWKMRYKDAQGKWRWHGLGSYPAISLAKARLLVSQKYKELELGAVCLTVSANKKTTFAEVLDIYTSEPKYKNMAQSSKQRNATTFKHILPTMGNRALKDITRADWLKLFKAIGKNIHNKTNKPTIAESHNAYRLVNRIYIFALNENLAGVESNPVIGLNDRLERHTQQPLAHISQDDLPKLIQDIKGIKSDITRICLLVMIHLYMRPHSIVGGLWAEIDFEKALWHIPAERMKKRRPHTIPLSSQVLALLTELHAITGHQKRLFPTRAKDAQSEKMRYQTALKRMGYDGKQTLHGFRHIAGTLLNNHTHESGNKFDERVIEFALAHKVQGVKGVYNRAEYLDDRRILNQFYSDFLDRLQA